MNSQEGIRDALGIVWTIMRDQIFTKHLAPLGIQGAKRSNFRE
jgi:hypothetical protein